MIQQKPDSQFWKNSLILAVVVVLLYLAAFCIRIYKINEEPLYFHPTRQYISALTARSYFYEQNDSLSEWRRQIAKAQKPLAIEPKIQELLTALLYTSMGSEKLWVGRLFPIIFWLIGGWPLFILSCKLFNKDAAVFSLAFYLFLPFGVTLSRAFMPDSLMLAAILWAVLAIWKYHEKPDFTRLLLAAVISAMAILVKITAFFIIITTFVSLTLYHKRWRGIFDRRLWLYLIILIAPALFHYCVLNIATTRLYSPSMFIPAILLKPLFYIRWPIYIYKVYGFFPILGLLFGFMLLRDRKVKAFISALIVGYILFGLTFSYHITTHDYYSIQLIIAMALILGNLCANVLSYIKITSSVYRNYAIIMSLLLLSLSLTVGFNLFFIKYKITHELRHHNTVENLTKEARVAKEIGEITSHSMKVIALDYNNRLFQYYGWLVSEGWGYPNPNNPWMEMVQDDLLNEDTDVRFKKRLYKTNPNYFVVTNLDAFDKDITLKEFLDKNFYIKQKDENYVIYDLTKAKK